VTVIIRRLALPWPLLDVLRLAGFRRLLLAQAVSEVGDWLTNVALILLLFRLLEHPAAAALVLLAKLVPRVLLYPFGGLLADRLDRRWLMITADLARAGLAASLLLVRSPEQVGWALAATALAQVLASLFNPAAMATVPHLTPPERLPAANALLGGVKEVAFVAGPLLGALAIAAGGVELAFLIDAASFLVSAALLAGLGGGARAREARPPLAVGRDLAEGWAVVRQQRAVAAVFVAQLLFGGLIAALNVLLVPLLVTSWRAPEAWLGGLYAAVGGGALLGALLALRLPPAGYLRTMLAMLGLIGAAALGLGLVPWLWAALALLALAGVATMVGDVAASSAIQAGVEGDRLGRVFGLLFWVIALGQAGGAAAGWAAGAAAPAWLVAGLGLATMAAAGLLAVALRPTGAPVTCLKELTRPS
jgi:hypothetical protein